MSKFIDASRKAATYPLHTRIAAGALTGLVSLSMTIPYGATAALAAPATTGSTTAAGQVADTAKNEVVYTKTDATGKASGIYVVNGFNTASEQTLSDPGSYEKVTNLSTSEKLSNEDGATELTTSAGQPFYYQGDLSTETKLPWKVELTYTLDGKEVTPSELEGASGDLDIELSITGLTDSSKAADFAKSFLLQAQGTFNNDSFKLEKATDATIATVGNQTLLTYLLLPGTDGDWHIKGEVSDFTYSGWQISAMPLNMAINVANYDTSQLTDAAGELEDGTARLASGSSELQSGLTELQATGTSQLASGSQRVAAGTDQLINALSSLPTLVQETQGGIAGLETQLAQIKADVDTLNTGATGLVSLATTASTNAGKVKADLEAMQAKLADVEPQLTSAGVNLGGASQKVQSAAQKVADLMKEGTITPEQGQAILADLGTSTGALGDIASAVGNVSAAGNDLKDAVAAAPTLESDAAALTGNLTQLQGGLGQVNAGVAGVLAKSQSALETGNTLVTSTSQKIGALTGQSAQLGELQNGARALAEGAALVDANMKKANAGATTLTDGAKTLASAVDGIDTKILDELQETIDEKLGRGYQLHSFVDASNTNVNEVEFVYVVDGITEDKDSDAANTSDTEDTSDESFIDKLIDLFAARH